MRHHNHTQSRYAQRAAVLALMCPCALAPSAAAATALDLNSLRLQVKPTVVQVLTDRGVALGSGFMLNHEGDVATNDHVVRGSQRMSVRQGGDTVSAILKWSSKDLDLAVIRMCKYATLENDPKRSGSGQVATLAVSSPDENTDKRVLAMGFPSVSEIYESGTTTEPTSADKTISRDLFRGSWSRQGQELLMIQHGAHISPGNSGGPLFDFCGRVVGVNTKRAVFEIPMGKETSLVLPAEGTYFASFIDELARALDDEEVPLLKTDELCEAPAGPDVVTERVGERPSSATLVVDTYPYDAQVEVVDDTGSAVPYSPGAHLRAGRYRVNVSAQGFHEKTVKVSHGHSDSVIRVHLDRRTAAFTVTAVPADASIQILNTCRRYQAGMELVKGRYEVQVSAQGYVPKREAVEHGSSPTVHEIELKRVDQPFTIVPVPADALVRLLGEGEVYTPGMKLPPGAYRVEVSAKRWKTTAVVTHPGGKPTQRRVALRFFDCSEGQEWCPEMVVVPPGSFLMGSSESELGRSRDEGPVHPVTFDDPFAVGMYEVTFEQWDRCAIEGGCRQRKGRWWPRRVGYFPEDEDWGRGRMPVINVSWDDAQNYLRWLGKETRQKYRLLSESEWEYVARAGKETPFHTGKTISTVQAHYNADKTVAVSIAGENDWGLHGVHGNVSEWTQDCYTDSYDGAQDDGGAHEVDDCRVRVVRGGSWRVPPSSHRTKRLIDYPYGLRAARRDYWVPYSGRKTVGFRVARDF